MKGNELMIKRFFVWICLLAMLLCAVTCHASEQDTDIAAGDYVFFGSYEQDNDETNGKEPIEWLVLEVQDSKALLLSRFAIEKIAYNYGEHSVTWEKCSLRSWLNSTFLEEAFTAAEQEQIQITEVDNSDSQGGPNSVPGCENTSDKVFALSYAEVEKYFPSKVYRICQETAYVKAKGGAFSGARWWERSPGSRDDRALEVYIDGGHGGTGVNVDYDNGSARPALWACTDTLIKADPATLPSVADETSSITEALALVAQARTLDDQFTLLDELASVYADTLETEGWEEDLNGVFAKEEKDNLIPDLEGAEAAENEADAGGLLKGRKMIAMYDDDHENFCLLGDFYTRLPEEMRAASLEEADGILYLDSNTESRTDYIGSAYDRTYGIYLIDLTDGHAVRLYWKRTTPPASGKAPLYGDEVPMETLWEVIRPLVYDV